jgi:hypothetical protein
MLLASLASGSSQAEDPQPTGRPTCSGSSPSALRTIWYYSRDFHPS